MTKYYYFVANGFVAGETLATNGLQNSDVRSVPTTDADVSTITDMTAAVGFMVGEEEIYVPLLEEQ